jgi:tRNA A-37 threonylcarbamoyl transferase component Bud32
MRVRATSSKITYNQDQVYKVIKRFFDLQVYEREVYWLRRLHNLDFVPKLISADDQSRTIIMENVGELMLTRDMLPVDYSDQLDFILQKLIENNCQHNDLNVQNFLVKDCKLYLIDFGWSTFIDDSVEKDEKLNLRNRPSEKEFDDTFTMNLLKKDLKDYHETGSLVQRV